MDRPKLRQYEAYGKHMVVKSTLQNISCFYKQINIGCYTYVIRHIGRLLSLNYPCIMALLVGC